MPGRAQGNEGPLTWQPSASIEAIRRRGEVTWQIRSFFQSQDFIEVHTPCLSADTVVDQHIEPVVVPAAAVGVESDAAEYFLQTSPEFCMKRLVAFGLEAVYQICPAFRSQERGPWHNPEFTMVEWYRVGDAMEQGVELLADLTQELFGYSPEVLTYRHAFAMQAGLDPISGSLEDLARLAGKITGNLDWSVDRDELLNVVFAECVQPRLGISRPTIVTNYPATQSALAKISASDPETADRFELFVGGVELANGYNELSDADELQTRNRAVAARRAGDGSRDLPQDSRLLAAMQADELPQCSGCALGLDRLVAVLLQAERIDDVVAFPIEIA